MPSTTCAISPGNRHEGAGIEAVSSVQDRAQWEAAIASARPAPLLQSWAWGVVQSQSGWQEVERLRLPVGAASVLVRRLGPLRWGFVPRGPVPFDEQSLEGLIDWARAHSLARLRVEPEAGSGAAELLAARGFQPGPDFNPSHTVVVPLGPEEGMLAGLKAKTRYNIRLAAKRGVVVEEGRDAAEMARQSGVTAARHRINLATIAHYERLLKDLDWCRTYVARVEGEAVAAILVVRYAGRAYYLFGGSDGRRREVMPNYAVQWAAMRAAAEAGCRDYDLWGVAPPEQPHHPLAGLNQFKTGFGGDLVSYAGTWDLVLAPHRQRAIGVLESARRLARRLRA